MNSSSDLKEDIFEGFGKVDHKDIGSARLRFLEVFRKRNEFWKERPWLGIWGATARMQEEKEEEENEDLFRYRRQTRARGPVRDLPLVQPKTLEYKVYRTRKSTM